VQLAPLPAEKFDALRVRGCDAPFLIACPNSFVVDAYYKNMDSQLSGGEKTIKIIYEHTECFSQRAMSKMPLDRWRTLSGDTQQQPIWSEGRLSPTMKPKKCITVLVLSRLLLVSRGKCFYNYLLRAVQRQHKCK